MIYAGDIVQNVLQAMRRESSEKRRADVWRWMNEMYFEVCRTISWKLLRRRLEIDFTAAAGDGTGIRIPSNVMGIDRIRDKINGYEFIERDRYDIEPDEGNWRYFTYQESNTAVFSADDIVLDTETSQFTSALLTADGTDYSDEWVKFGRQYGFYQLSSAATPFTFAPQYNGPGLSQADFDIRPSNTLRLVLQDRNENYLSDRSIYMYYWVTPEPLYRENDFVVLPTGKPLELMTLIRALGVMGKRQISTDRYRGELKDAMDEALTLNPSATRQTRPRDLNNQIFDISQNIFGDRDTGFNDTDATLRDIFQRS